MMWRRDRSAGQRRQRRRWRCGRASDVESDDSDAEETDSRGDLIRVAGATSRGGIRGGPGSDPDFGTPYFRLLQDELNADKYKRRREGRGGVGIRR